MSIDGRDTLLGFVVEWLNMKKVILLIIILIIVFVSLGVFLNNQKTGGLNMSVDFKELDESEEILNRLSVDQKVGQIFMIGFEGTEMNEEIESLIKEVHPGAILLLGRNIENEKQLKELINSLQKLAIEDTGLPLLIAVDQEGGLVSRIDWVEKTSQLEIETEQQAYSVAKQRAQELKELGINLNLAPLLDLLDKDDFIYNRGFLKNHNALGKKMVEGYKDGGILSCVKHFPGYGGISFHPEDSLASVEKIPEFSQFKNINSELIMVSNVVYLELNKDLPFSFLKEGISLLKEEVKGEYLIISDDLSQYSLLKNFTLEDIISRPFLAGVDILIFSGWRSSIAGGVLVFKKEIKNGDISQERINEAVLKIIKLKQKLISVDITGI